MSVLFFEGFETVGTELGLANQATTRPRIDKRWDATNAGGAPTTDSFFLINDNFSEGFAVQMGENNFSNGNYLQWNVPESLQGSPGAGSTVFIVGARVHIPSASRSFKILDVQGFGLDPDPAISFEVENSANIVVKRGAAATEIGRSNGAVTSDSWHYIEMRFRVADSPNGIIEVKVDNSQKIIDESADTNPALTEDYDHFKFRTTVASTTSGDYVAYDDIYIVNADVSPHQTFLRPVRVRSLPPNNDFTPLNWTPSSAVDHYTLVDENGNDNSDYVESSTNGDKDMYDITDLPFESSIFAVKVEVEAINTTTGSPTMDVRLRSGTAADTNNVTVDNTADSEVFTQLSDQDPQGGNWTETDVDNAKVGMEITGGF